MIRRYADLHAPLLPILRYTLAQAALPRAGLALDLACGAGEKGPILAQALGPGVQLLGVDIDRALARSYQRTIVGDARALPLCDACLDAAFCIAALGLLADPVAALRELRRALRPGAPAVIFTAAQLWAQVIRWPEDLAEQLAIVDAEREERGASPDLGGDLAGKLADAGFASRRTRAFLLEDAPHPSRLELPLLPWAALRPLAASRLSALDLARCDAAASAPDVELTAVALVGVAVR